MVPRVRSSGWRPPAINCCVWAKNSMSRMPPRPELDVVTAHGDRTMALEGMHPPLHGVDIGDRGEVEIFPPDEWRELVEELLASRGIAGHDPRLDQRRPLPVLAEALVVDEAGFGRECDLRRAGIGP